MQSFAHRQQPKVFDILALIDSTSILLFFFVLFFQVIYPLCINEPESFCFGFMIWNFDEDIQSFSAWLACAVSLMTVTAAEI